MNQNEERLNYVTMDEYLFLKECRNHYANNGVLSSTDIAKITDIIDNIFSRIQMTYDDVYEHHSMPEDCIKTKYTTLFKISKDNMTNFYQAMSIKCINDTPEIFLLRNKFETSYDAFMKFLNKVNENMW